MISEIVIYRYKTEFDGDIECKDGGSIAYKGTATTDLDPGIYAMTVDKVRRRYVVERPEPKARGDAYRFILEIDGTDDVYALAYAPRVRLKIEGSGPKLDPFKEMLYGMGPDAYADEETYIDNLTAGTFDLVSNVLAVTHRDGVIYNFDLDDLLVDMHAKPGGGVTVYTYFRDIRNGKIFPNVMDPRSCPNLGDMALDVEKQRADALFFRQLMDAGVQILTFMQLSIGMLRVSGTAGGGPPGGRWKVRKPPQQELAKGIVNGLKKRGLKIIINIGGEGEEAGAINVNPNRRLGNTEIENFIETDAAELGQLFEPGSVDGIVSNRLPPNVLNWGRILPAAARVMKPGSRIIIRFQGAGADGKVIMPLLKQLKFTQINDWGGSGAIFEAVR